MKKIHVPFRRVLAFLLLFGFLASTSVLVPFHTVFAANSILIVEGTQILVANSTYNPGDANHDLGSSITDDIDMVGLTTGQARGSVKIDLGATRAGAYHVRVAMEWATDPNVGGTIDLYWSSSHSATAAVGNTGETTGADGDYAGYDTLTLEESLRQTDYIGSLVAGQNNQADGIQIGSAGVWSSPTRYGVLIVVNNTDDTLHSDSVEMAVAFDPIITQVQ